MDTYKKVKQLYPRLVEKDFNFLEVVRQLMPNAKNYEIRDYITRVVRDVDITAGLRSYILGGQSIDLILLYPYSGYPKMQHININDNTLKKLDKVVNSVEWKIVVNDTWFRIEQTTDSTDLKQSIHTIANEDEEVTRVLSDFGITIPKTQTHRLHISLANRHLVNQSIPEELKQDIPLTVTGVAIGYSLAYPKFSWFMVVLINIQKIINNIKLTMNIECQPNSHITFATIQRHCKDD